jgi:hypothetical protein
MLLQACIITLDEADNISACLESLDGLVDSVLVYDTGSNDETVSIARRHGATVIQGYWDDDFAAARNRALQLCESEWILSIDADEVLHCNVQDGIRRSLLGRRRLPDNGDVQAFEATIRNVLVIPPVNNVTLFAEPVETGALVDSGEPGELAEPRVLVESTKPGELVEPGGLAEPAELEAPTGEERFPVVTHSAVRLFRREQACWSGRLHERVVDRASGRQLLTAGTRMFEIIHFGYAISRTDSKKKAERNLKLVTLEESGNDQEFGDNRAIMLLKTGKAKWAANQLNEALEDLLAAASADGEHGILAWMALKSALQVALWLDGADRAIELYGRLNTEFPSSNYPNEGLPWSILSFMAACTAHDDHAALEIAATLDSAARQLVIAQAMNIGRNCAGNLLEGTYYFFQEQEDVLATLAVASRVAPRLDVETARRWSQRMRSTGLSELCPLMAIARDTERDHSLRVHAATVAFEEFADSEAGELLKVLTQAGSL